jgi:sporulation protein YlmC with PRC-barrel domain
VAGLIGRSVYDRRGNRVGRVHDLIVALGNGGDHPPLHGILVRTGRKVVFVPYTAIAGIRRWEVYLTTSGLQPHPLPDRNGFVALAGVLLDRRLLDADGVRTARVSDLVLACMVDEILLVGADASIRTLVRRAGTGWMRRRVAARRVHDWAAVSVISPSAPAESTVVLHLAEAGEPRHGPQGAVHGEHSRTPGPWLAWRSSAPTGRSVWPRS